MAEETEYIIAFEFTHIDDPEPKRGTTSIKAEEPIDPNDTEHFQEIAKTLFREIEGCETMRILSVAEEDDMIKELREILNSNAKEFIENEQRNI